MKKYYVNKYIKYTVYIIIYIILTMLLFAGPLITMISECITFSETVKEEQDNIALLEAIFDCLSLGLTWIFLSLKIFGVTLKKIWKNRKAFCIFLTACGEPFVILVLGIIGVSLWLKIQHYIDEFDKYELDLSSLVCVGFQGNGEIAIDAEKILEEFKETMNDATDSFVFLNYIATIIVIVAGSVALFMVKCCDRCCGCCASSDCCMRCKGCYLKCTLRFILCVRPDDDDIDEIEMTYSD